MIANRVLPTAVVTRYVPALTGLRAVAAYAVFLHHYNPAPSGTFIHALLDQGYVGVTVFFILSGFLIYHRYAAEFISGVGWSWRRYFRNRFARIYSLYAFLLLLTIGAGIIRGQPIDGLLLGLNLTLLKGFFVDYKFSGIPQSWSLTVEICFYLSAPLLFRAIRRWNPLLIAVCLLAIGMLLWLTVGSRAWHGLFGNPSFILFYTFFGRSFEFIAGMWLARRWHEDRLPSIPYAMQVGLLLSAGCLCWQAFVPAFLTNANELIISEAIVYNGLLPVGITLFMMGFIQGKSVVQWLLATPVVQALGRSSYAFYLIHIGVISQLIQTCTDSRLILFGLLVVLAHGLYLTIERPLQRWLKSA